MPNKKLSRIVTGDMSHMGMWYTTPDGDKFVEKAADIPHTPTPDYMEPTFRRQDRITIPFSGTWKIGGGWFVPAAILDNLKSRAHEDFVK